MGVSTGLFRILEVVPGMNDPAFFQGVSFHPAVQFDQRQSVIIPRLNFQRDRLACGSHDLRSRLDDVHDRCRIGNH